MTCHDGSMKNRQRPHPIITEPNASNLVHVLKEDLSPRAESDTTCDNIKCHNEQCPMNSSSSSSSSDYAVSGDELNYNSCDETLAILQTVDSPYRNGGVSEAGDAPMVKCCMAFWDISSYCILFVTSFWISFIVLMLFQPTMNDIRREIADIDPVSGQNHPIVHRSRSDPLCTNYTLSDLAQFTLSALSVSFHLSNIQCIGCNVESHFVSDSDCLC